VELTPTQLAILQTLHGRGFEIVAFPKYATHIGIRRGACAALLTALGSGGFEILGTPTYMIGENLAVRVKDGARESFVWKKEKLEATPERLAELADFGSEVANALLPRT
jgi:hypothetical protein